MAKGKLTDQLISDAVQCKRNGMTNKDTAAYIGISEATFYAWANQPKGDKQVEFSEALKKAEADFKAALRSRIIKASDTSWQAAAWMLERLYPEEYAKPEAYFAHKEAIAAAASAPVVVLGVKPKANDGD